MLASYGEVRESGLTGVTRNHVCPRGTGGSNPPLSATFQTRHAPSNSPASPGARVEARHPSYVCEGHRPHRGDSSSWDFVARDMRGRSGSEGDAFARVRVMSLSRQIAKWPWPRVAALLKSTSAASRRNSNSPAGARFSVLSSDVGVP